MKDPLNDQLKELNEALHVNAKNHQLLKQRILQQQTITKRAHKKYWVAVVVMCILFLLSPFYSSTMANLAAKILPLNIQSGFSQNGDNSSHLTSQIGKLTEQEGYQVNAVGARTSPFTIDISVFPSNSHLKEVKEHLQPIIETFLYEQGIDEYELLISETEPLEEVSESDMKRFDTYEQATQIVNNVFTSFGYEEEVNNIRTGFTHKFLSFTLGIDMPDHIKEQANILATIEKEMKAQNLNLKEIEVTTFNLKHRLQDSRWGVISSDILNALIGKSRYHVTGLSYKVKKGHTNVYLKTSWEQPPTAEITNEITDAINTYLELPEVQGKIANDPYTIKLRLKNGDEFIVITDE